MPRPTQMTPTAVPPAASPATGAPTMPPPHDDSVFASEGAFTEHLVRFLTASNFPEKRIPHIAGRPIPLMRLYQLICSLGGCANIASDLKKWQRIAASLQIPTDSVESLTLLRSTYLLFLYPYEQYYFQRKPLDKIECKKRYGLGDFYSSLLLLLIFLQFLGPHKKQMQKPAPSQMPPHSQQPPSVSSQPAAANTPASTPALSPVVQQAPLVLFISDSNPLAWKPFAAVAMKPPMKPVDLDSIALRLLSPFKTLQLDGFLQLQSFLTATENGRFLKFPSSMLPTIIRAFEQLCPISKLSSADETNWTFESLMAAEDSRRRDLLIDHLDKKNAILEQISLTLQLLTVTRPEYTPLIANYPFVSQFLLSVIKGSGNFEAKVNAVMILEAVSAYLPASATTNTLLAWCLEQCIRELVQIRTERATTVAARVTALLNNLSYDRFDSPAVARQTTNLVIGNLGQFWRSIPAHLFSLLSSAIHLLSKKHLNDSDGDGDGLGAEEQALHCDLTRELFAFVELFFVPICVLVRSVRSYLKVLIDDPCSIEELRKILETLLFSPSFSLSDGGYVELCLRLIQKCTSRTKSAISSVQLDSLLLLVEEMRHLWLLPPFDVQLGKSCFATASANSSGSPKRSRVSTASVVTNELAISKGSSAIMSAHSHPFMILSRSLSLLAVNFDHLNAETQLRLFELAMEWSVDAHGYCREVLNCDRLEPALAQIRDKFFNND